MGSNVELSYKIHLGQQKTPAMLPSFDSIQKNQISTDQRGNVSTFE